jgi:hypothetical protein
MTGTEIAMKDLLDQSLPSPECVARLVPSASINLEVGEPSGILLALQELD